MKFRLKRIGVLKAAIMGGIGYALLSLLLVPFFLFFMMFAPGPSGLHDMPGEFAMSGALVFLLPLIYGVMGFIGTALAAAVFNLISLMVGGLDIELDRDAVESLPPAPPQPGP